MIVTVVTVLLSSSLIVACSKHTNPLLTENKVEAAKFIVEAEYYAIDKMGLNMAVDTALYQNCNRDITRLDNPFQKTSNHKCNQFFKEMVAYGKTKSKFRALSISDLHDRKALQRLSDDIEWFESTEADPAQMKAEEQRLLKGKP